MESFPPELRLLLGLLRAALGTAELPPPPAATDWTRFLALVVRHRVGAFLHARVGKRIAPDYPAHVTDRLAAIADATLQRALDHAAEQIRLVRALTDEGIGVLAVKGLVLGQQLYHGLGRRHVGDIDLLVRRRDAERADAVLQKDAGLRRTRPGFALTPRQTRAYLQVKPEFEYQRSAPAIRIELLWRLEGLPPAATDDAWARAVPAQIGGHPVRTLAPDVNALYLLQHGARHAWFRLFWLVDAALLLRDPAIDWRPLAGRARGLGVERSVLQGAALAQELLGVATPAALDPPARARATIAALAAEARRQIAREPQRDEPVGEWFRQTAYRLRLPRSARARLAVIAPHLFSPLNWQTWPLPDRCFLLYYPASPLLWLWRRLGRSRAARG